MVGSSGDSGRDRTGTCSGADANGRTVPHMACRLEKPIFDCFPRTGRGVGLLTKGEVERTMVLSGRWESNPHSQLGNASTPVVAPHPSEVSDCPVTACNRCSGTFGARRPRSSRSATSRSNWIQLAVTWAAFALFILALSFL